MTHTLTMQWMDSERETAGRTQTRATRGEDALEVFLRGIERRALRIAELSVGGRDDALDIVQDSMLTFVRNYRGKPQADWAPLFHRVLDSRVLDFHRRNSTRARWLGWVDRLIGRDGEEIDAIAEIPDTTTTTPWQHIADGESAGAIDAALRALPNRQRQAFLLRVWEGLDVADTARAMACSEGSVKTHYFRALQTLRAKLGDFWT